MDKPWEIPDAGAVAKLWQECVDDMLGVRRSFALNNAYLNGDQWVNWSDSDATVNVLPFADQNESKYRTVVNKFRPRTNQLMARMLRTPLAFEARPGGVDSAALRRARLESQILEAKHHKDDWEMTRSEELLNTLLGGVSAVCMEPTWEYETEPVQDIDTGEWFRMPERPSLKLTALSAAEFGIEPGSRTSRDALWWIKCTTLTPRQVKKRYGLDWTPTTDADSALTPMQRNLVANRKNYTSKNRSCLVYVYYERPTDKTPGCVVHVVNKKVVEHSPWPFNFDDRLNLQPFIQSKMSGSWQGNSFLDDVRQLQRNYNRAYTSINAHMGKADSARLMVPLGSIDDDTELTGEVGEITRYDASNGAAPAWLQPPQVPRWLREHISSLEMEMDDAFSSHAVSRGVAPGDRNSGLALNILAEKDDTPLGLMAGDQQRGWQSIAEMVLRTEKYLLQQAAKNGSEVQVRLMLQRQGDEQPVEVNYRADDLSDDPTIYVPLDSVMPRSLAATQDMMLKLATQFPMQFQGLNFGQLATMLQVPDLAAAFTAAMDPEIALAQWENSRILAGADEIEVEIAEWQDHAKHIAEHNRDRASSAYRDAPQSHRDFMDTHIEAHTHLAADQMMKQDQQAAQFDANANGGVPGAPPPGGPMGGPPPPGGSDMAPQPQPQGAPPQ